MECRSTSLIMQSHLPRSLHIHRLVVFSYQVCSIWMLFDCISFVLNGYLFYCRIPYEEQLLINFYGEEYVNYIHRTYIGIPFIYSNTASSLKYASTSSRSSISNNSLNSGYVTAKSSGIVQSTETQSLLHAASD